MVLSRLASVALALIVASLLAACSDQRASFEIKGSANSLSLIRVTGMPWEKTAEYSIVAARLPDCMRRHAMGKAPLNAKVEIYSPGNDAWIVKVGSQMYVTETRSCEGFAKLDKVPDGGLGPLMGTFEMRAETLVFSAAPQSAQPVVAPAN
jgi:hypothetical protein